MRMNEQEIMERFALEMSKKDEEIKRLKDLHRKECHDHARTIAEAITARENREEKTTEKIQSELLKLQHQLNEAHMIICNMLCGKACDTGDHHKYCPMEAGYKPSR